MESTHTAPPEVRGPRVLQFELFSSCIDSGFWSALTRKKLDVYGLDETAKSIHGYYSIGSAAFLPCFMNVDHASFEATPSTDSHTYPLHGKLQNFNTIEKFRDSDKQLITDGEANELWNLIMSGEALVNPSLLSRFTLLSFVDLKKYIYSYWFLFPALVYPDALVHETEPRPIQEAFTGEEISHITNFVAKLPKEQNAFLIAHDADGAMEILLIRDLPLIVKDNRKVTLCVCDPSVRADNPGWTVRNVLAMFAYHVRSSPEYRRVQLVCFRQRFRDGLRDVSHSLVLDLRIVFTPNQTMGQTLIPKAVGWERTEKGKLGSRHVNLSAQMDPKKLAEQAVDLNLKLMRWRLVPELDLPLIQRTKCLILGSGTLGCNVARCLMGWGIFDLTFVDNSVVSFSNPVRQSLFSFSDCLDGGKEKSIAAVEAVQRIFPGVCATAHQMNIPMPGHPISESMRGKVDETITLLEALIEKNDVVFLLMDTRESRWLPTLIGASKRKIVMNAALGFDSYLVMRHGMSADGAGDETNSKKLGCYFCNDVVAPGNSTRDRTLDQQCTVTRPGIAMIAAALAVELLVTVLQHPKGAEAPADSSARDDYLTNDIESPLGIVPHQIRGFLARHNTVLPATTAFDKCTACSATVIKEYEARGHDFLFDVINSTASFLEDLTGLTKLHADSEKAEVWDLSDDESFAGSE
ncbi:Ubiquitin-like modifier-activating enzyme ATG7 [Hypsibius exemplaris]|uniref:Ubiquitin-like modifier-activating enzyme ATG7 n=1 Tax=Hypsibius exemplaris TaxID=2072580 RepID=A0A1W0WHF5_HYPEX|nr:Ubiquitin-like modifier-activating enzyme ATG7 [Hypsibius exemplaris]